MDNALLEKVRDRLEDARVADSDGNITSKHFLDVDSAISEAVGQLCFFNQSAKSESSAGQLRWTAPPDRIPAEEDLASVHHQAIKDFQAIIEGHTGPLEGLILQPNKYARLKSVFRDLNDAEIRQLLTSAQTAREKGSNPTPQPAPAIGVSTNDLASQQSLDASRKLAAKSGMRTPRTSVVGAPSKTTTARAADLEGKAAVDPHPSEIRWPRQGDHDREALLALYWSSGGPRWRHKRGWANNSANLGDWYGVSVDETGRVSKIDLPRNALEGTIPASICYMTRLAYLRLSSNSLTGPIPPVVGELSQLTYFDVGSNQLTGSLPPAMGKLKNVSKIDLSNNFLRGFIPPEFGGMEKLLMCWLEKNHIQGPIPPEMANIPNLMDLDLTENRLKVGRLQGVSLMNWRAEAMHQLAHREIDGYTQSGRARSRTGGGSSRDEHLERTWSRSRPTGAFNVEAALLNLMGKDREIATLRAELLLNLDVVG